MLFSGKENVFMCLVAFQKNFWKIFSGVWKRRRKRQTQKKNHQQLTLNWVWRRSASRAPVRRPRRRSQSEIAISRSVDRNLARSARTGARNSPAIVGLTGARSSPLVRTLSLSLSLSFSGNTLKWKWECKMVSVVKAIFFRSTDFNFRKIEFSEPTKQPHFRKSIFGSDFHPKQTHPNIIIFAPKAVTNSCFANDAPKNW